MYGLRHDGATASVPILYDAEQDSYHCPAGQQLQRISHTRGSSRSCEQWAYACDADALQKFTNSLARQYGKIYLGNVSPKRLSQTRMAKSGWGLMKMMLEYKCAHAGSVFKVVDERNITRTCSSCGALSGPQGVNGLRIRAWTCGECGVTYDRDINAARNILAAGHGRPAEGITGL